MNNNETQQSTETLTTTTTTKTTIDTSVKPDDKPHSIKKASELTINQTATYQQAPFSAPPQYSTTFFQQYHNKRFVSSSNLYTNQAPASNRHSHRVHRTQTEHVNLSHYKQQAPFVQASYHHNTNLIIDKYNRKYNLISFILLRKYDNFINEEKIYLNDQLLYNLIKNFIQNIDYESIINLYKQNKGLQNYKNSYNSSIFIYTIRESLDFVFSNETVTSQHEIFLKNLFSSLFELDIQTELANLNDGDYPMRNIVHYSARYNSIFILELLIKHLKSEDIQRLCLLNDYNGNTPLHLAVQYNSLDFIKFIHENQNALFKQINFDYAYNYDGFNLILLACRYSSLDLIKYLHETIGLSLNLKELNQNSLKTCLHLAILRTLNAKIDTYLSVFKIIIYLYEQNNYLAYELSPLVGSVYHIAASNLTRLHILWYFLNEYNETHDKSNGNEINLSVNSYDFRQLSCIDCFIDTLITIREIIPTSETIYSFYKKYFYKDDDDDDASTQLLDDHFNNETQFNYLIKKSLFKLIAKCKSKITKLPQIKTQLQLLEFLKLFKFMSKFHFKLQAKFDSIYYTKFEAFCLKFLNTFIFTGDLLPVLSTNIELDQNNNHTLPAVSQQQQQQQQVVSNLNEIYLEILNELVELTRIIVTSGFFTSRFQQKIYSFMCDYFTNLNQQYEKYANNNVDLNKSLKLKGFLNELNKFNNKTCMFSLQDLCRYKINYCLFNSKKSLNSVNEIYSSLPIAKSYDILNNLTFDLISDLFGNRFSDINENDEIFRYI